MTKLSAVLIYFLIALCVGLISYRKTTNTTGFLMGNRSMGAWLTAMAAHASDMSNWLFMAYPATIFIGGLFNSWAAIGLSLCMLLNWQWIAPKLRVMTEKMGTLTLSTFFEAKLKDDTGRIRLFSAALCFLFYSVYISAGLVGFGYLAESLFGIPYFFGIFIGVAIVIAYVIIGGFLTLPWLDLFQGLFLLGVILIAPFFILPHLGGLEALKGVMSDKPSLIPSLKGTTFLHILTLSLGWGLGYFGQPHILTKFMGIRDISKIKASKRVGMTWMVLSLTAATFIGIIATAFFSQGVNDPEMIFVEMVKNQFSPFLASFILCAILAAIINVVSSQLLVISSILSEDFYRKLFPVTANEKKSLLVSRLGIVACALFAMGIAAIKPASIFDLVLYAWSGLGAAFGPLLLHTLYAKRLSTLGAWLGMISGGVIVALWPLLNSQMAPLLPAFIVSLGINWGVSRLRARVPIRPIPQK
ncbi:MAG: sodium/proline symporter [Chlamydiia bacterium]|nr:sodium/proline symporter [Chlamydiia bacterium]